MPPETSLVVHLLGGFRLVHGDAVVLDQGWSRRKALALLKVVALQPAGLLHRDLVCEALWPDLDPRAATNNLHKNLHYLRSALADHIDGGDILALRGDVVALSADVQVDLRELRKAVEVARGSEDVAAYDHALRLARHELLPEDAYEDWAITAREELEGARSQLLREVVALHVAQGRLDAAIERTREILQIEPTDEDAHRTLMQLYFESGSRHRALRQYEICRDILESELGVEPSPATVALHARLQEEAPPDGGMKPAIARSGSPAARQVAGDAVQADRAPQADAAPQGDAASQGDAAPRTSAPRTHPRAPAPRPVTYGRERELEIIESALDDAVSGNGSLLLLVGEAGIGKSHLLRHASAAADEVDAIALYGRAYEFDAHLSYQPLRGVLRQLTQDEIALAVEPELRRSLYLRRLMPDAPLELAPGGESADLQAELLEEAWRLFAAISAQRPLVVLLDDLHAADEGTLRLVHMLARRAREARLLVIAAAREEPAGEIDPLASMRAALRRDRVARELSIATLDAPALRLVAQSAFESAAVDADLLRDVTDRAQGNPLFARELASSFIEQGWARFERDAWHRRSTGPVPVPLAAHDLLQSRLGHLSTPARELLNAAAVSPMASTFSVLQPASGLDRRQALDALDECIAALLLEEADGGYRFRHELVRQAAYESLTTARRQQLHRSQAEALTSGRTAAEPGIVGYHLAQSDEPWLAVPYLVESGRLAESVFAHDQARDAFQRAVRIARDEATMVDPTVGASAIEELGDLERRTGNVEGSVPLFEEAASILQRAGEADGAARARGKAALGHIILGNAGEAQRHIEQTLDALTEQSPQHVVSRTYYLLAQLHWHSGQNTDALEAAKQALLAAREGQDPRQQAQAYEVLALACHSLGDWKQGIEYELSRQALGMSGFDTDEAFDAHL